MSTTEERKLADDALAALATRQTKYALYRDYYNGDHGLAFATDKFKTAFGALFTAFADNLCPAIVDAPTDRLELTGFAPEEGTSEQAATDAWTIWNRNRMDLRAGEVHHGAFRDGDSYLIVQESPTAPGTAQLYPNAADLLTVIYDDEQPGLIALAIKRWKLTNGRWRINLYFRDKTERYISKATNAPARIAQYDAFGPDVPNVHGIVPVFHFANNAPLGLFGQSQLRNALPLQDALNKSIMDMVVAMEYFALPQRWATGMEIPIDPATGVPSKVTAAAVNKAMLDRLITTAVPDARFGQFDAADLTQFLQVQDSFRLAMARDTGTPLHYVVPTNDPPSGEALKTLEARFVKLVKDRQTAFGNVWEDALSLALRIEGKGTADTRLSAQWVDPAPTSEREQAETLQLLKNADVPTVVGMEIAGYGDDVIAKTRTEKASAAARMQRSLQAVPNGTQNGTAVLQSQETE